MNRYLVVSDIHGNLEAFQAVLDDAKRRGGWDRVLCLGDTTGYGADPAPCLDLLRSLDHVTVAGNHDRAAVALLPIAEFNAAAASAVEWTARSLRPNDLLFLHGLPLTAAAGAATLVHGSLRDPVWEYLVSPAEADATFRRLSTSCCFVGHSHVPLLFQETPDGAVAVPFRPDAPRRLSPGRWILNPGGAGQPRDGDPRAAYVLYDEDGATATLHRVAYDVEAARRKILAAGLPRALGDRLRRGL